VASFQITAVRTESSASGLHEHISAVQIGCTSELSRSTVVNDIRYGSDSYYTEVGGAKADVIVVECPYCTFSDYIKTTADYTTADLGGGRRIQGPRLSHQRRRAIAAPPRRSSNRFLGGGPGQQSSGFPHLYVPLGRARASRQRLRRDAGTVQESSP
jgi:hypothetical protein